MDFRNMASLPAREKFDGGAGGGGEGDDAGFEGVAYCQLRWIWVRHHLQLSSLQVC